MADDPKSVNPSARKPALWPIPKRSLIMALICIAIWTFGFSLEHSLLLSVLGALAIAALIWLVPVALWNLRLPRAR